MIPHRTVGRPFISHLLPCEVGYVRLRHLNMTEVGYTELGRGEEVKGPAPLKANTRQTPKMCACRGAQAGKLHDPVFPDHEGGGSVAEMRRWCDGHHEWVDR